MKRYVDGFVLPIPKQQVSNYEAIAQAAAEIWKEHGALEYSECLADDLQTDCSRSFVDMTNATKDETVIFAWAVFASRQARDTANEKIAADPRMAKLMADLTDSENPILDFQRMAHGGFTELVRA